MQGNLTKEQIMSQIQRIVIQSRNSSLNTFFQNFDCYKGRILEVWDFQIMFNLSVEQANALQQLIGQPNKKGIEFEHFVDILYKQYCSNLTLQPLSDQSVYATRMKIVKITQSAFQFIARSLLQATSIHTYNEAFDSSVPKSSQKTITKDELQQMFKKLAVQVSTQENEDIFNYLKLDITNIAQVSKIQFIQGFRYVLPDDPPIHDNHQADGINKQTSQFGNNNNSTFGQNSALATNLSNNDSVYNYYFIIDNDPLNEFFYTIKQYLQTNRMTLDQAFAKNSSNNNAKQIYIKELEILGRMVQAKPLQDHVISQFLKQHEDFQPNFIKKDIIQRLVDESIDPHQAPAFNQNQFSNTNNMNQNQFTNNNNNNNNNYDNNSNNNSNNQNNNNNNNNNNEDRILRDIKTYLEKNYIQSIEKVFPQAQTMPGGLVTVNRFEFLQFLTSYDKIGLGRADADAIVNRYSTHQGSDSVNLAKLRGDLIALGAANNNSQNFQFDHNNDNNLNSNKLTSEKALEHVHTVFDSMKRYIAINGGNIVSRFREIDSNGDQLIQKDEMRQTLYKLGLEQVGDDLIEGIYQTYDLKNEGEIPYIDFCKKFYVYANLKQVKEPSDWIFTILEQVKKYLKQHRTTLASVFATDLANYYSKKEVYLESFGFFERLKYFGVAINLQTEQKLLHKLDPKKQNKIDYLFFSDLIGYEQPDEINQMQQFNQFQAHASIADSLILRNTLGKDYRKNFYRTLCRHLKQNGVTVKRMEMQIGQMDVNNSSQVPITTFINQLMSFCMGSELFGQKDLIGSMSKDFDYQNNNQVHYIAFIQKIGYETDKLRLLEQFYWTMKQALDFKASANLYEMLAAYDQRRDKRFNKEEIAAILKSKNISTFETANDIGFLFDEYDAKNTGFIEYSDLEKDYQEFVQWIRIHKPQQNVNMVMNLPQILRQIKHYSEYTGKSLREIFNKMNIGDTDEVFNFDFSKILDEITNQQIDSDSIDRLTQELNITGNNNSISFSELMKRYNEEFNIREDPYEAKFNQRFVQRIYWHVAKICSAKGNKFRLEEHFEYPASNFNQFINDLEKAPLLCIQICTKQLLEEIAKSYQTGSYIDTKTFIHDINDKVKKLQLRASIFLAIKKQLQFRGSTIEEAFKNIKGLGVQKSDNLAIEEFYAVLLSVEYKIDMAQLSQILETFQHDNEGKVSYVDFVKEFKDQTPLKEGIQARKFFQNERDILEHIAQMLMKRDASKQFGNLLASSDMEGKGNIQRDAFYRIIESMNFSLGEGDIQELIRAYDPLKLNVIQIGSFTDEINKYIHDQHSKIQLVSQINQTVKERIVEEVQMTPRSLTDADRDFKSNQGNQKIIQDIYCGLLVKSRDLQQWFLEYAKQPNYIIQAEFTTALDHLEVQGTYDQKTQFYDTLLKLQNNLTNQKLQTLQIDFLQTYLGKDFTMSKDHMIQQILRDCAQELTVLKVPVKDQFMQFDPQVTGQVFRNDFSSNILENYLRLSNVLTSNKINLLLIKYDPNSTFRVNYNEFIGDLKKIENESPHLFNICLTQRDVEQVIQKEKEEEKWDNEDQANKNNQYGNQKEPDPVAKSKKNTIAIERDIHNIMKMQIPSFQFEDIMIATYKRDMAVEVYFKQYARFQDRSHVLEKDQFFEAVKKLNIKWAEPQKISELFDAIDIAANGRFQRQITIEDVGMALLQNTQYNVLDYQAKAVENVYKQLKDKKLLGKLRDIFNFYNSRRDSTCTSKDFKQAFLNELDMKATVSETDIEILIQRYKTLGDAQRVTFTKFLTDIELVDKGISPVLLWAIDFAEDVMKGLIVFEYSNLEQFFSKFTKLSGIILYEEFRKAMDELQITLIHDESVQRDFFNSVDTQSQRSVNTGTAQVSKVGLTQLINSTQKLIQSNQNNNRCNIINEKYFYFIETLSQIYQEILEKIFAASKRVNLSQTVYHMFNEFDMNKTGYVKFQDFKYCIEQKLKAFDVKNLDIEVLSKKYKATQKGVPGDMVRYEKFFQDYERIEKLGLRAGDDPLRKPDKQEEIAKENLEIPPDVKKIYNDMGTYVQSKKFVDNMCDALVKSDTGRTGFVPETVILAVFQQNKMMLNTRQMSLILLVLPFNSVENVYNYIKMIELLFGKQKAQEVQQKNHIIVAETSKSGIQIVKKDLEIRLLFKDAVELRYSTLSAYAHQISKGSYKLREQEFYSIFKKTKINILSSDIEFLQMTFRKIMNQQSRAIDFNSFVEEFKISKDTSRLLSHLQNSIIKDKIDLEKVIQKDFVDFDEFQSLLKNAKIQVDQYDPQMVRKLFMQLCEGKAEIQKGPLIRMLGKEEDLESNLKQEQLPYVVNELAAYIVNNGINIFKAINPQAKVLTRQQVSTLLTQIKFQPSNPKEMETLFIFFAMDDSHTTISTQKVVAAIRSIDPTYGEAKPQLINKQSNPNVKGSIQNAKAAQFQLSQFNTKIKQILVKMNQYLKKNAININNLHSQIDKNKNGLVERDEMLNFFRDDMPIPGMGRADYEQIFDAIDFNRDGYISVNEFCLYLEGTNLTQEQKMLHFDKTLEAEMKVEIEKLFQFFDKNGDGRISIDEVMIALKSFNPLASMQEAKILVAQADKNGNGFIDKTEFEALMLPKYKEDMILNEANLDDLRRLFKEADKDHSNYLNKFEIQNALLKVGVELSLDQLDELMQEIDVDMNGAIDIDEFIGFLSLADQFKFKNENSRSTLINIRRVKKLHPIDFYNAFKNLPAHYSQSFTQERFEQQYQNTPSHEIFPEFDSKSMTYKDLNKIADLVKIEKGTKPIAFQSFTNMYTANIGCEISMEEATGVFLPKKEEFEWSKISHREVRAFLFDFQTKEYVSNSFIIQANWRTEYENKWLFNYNSSHALAKNFFLRTDLLSKLQKADYTRDIHLLFELVIYTKGQATNQQVTCAWGSIPLTQLDKAAKQKVQLKGGSPFSEVDVDPKDIHQSKKGFQFLKKIVVNTNDTYLIVNVRPQAKFSESSQLYMSMLPSTCLVSKRLLSFVAAFRIYCFKKLTKAEQQMIAPQGNFVIAQFKKIFDNPDINLWLGECWASEVTALGKQDVNLINLVTKMENFITTVYSIIYSTQYHFDHVYPTRSESFDADIFLKRETLIKQQLLPSKSKVLKDLAAATKTKATDKTKQQQSELQIPQTDYKPFKICEMDVQVNGIDPLEAKQDELLKMYKQMGLIY